MLMTQFVAGNWVLGVLGGMLIPISLGLIINARRQMIREIKSIGSENSDD